jgi:hypothetical protein
MIIIIFIEHYTNNSECTSVAFIILQNSMKKTGIFSNFNLFLTVPFYFQILSQMKFMKNISDIDYSLLMV